MEDYLKHFKIRNLLILLSCLLLSGLIIYGLLSYFVLQKLKIKGPYYQQIIQIQDFLANLVPPPAYLGEAYLSVFQQYVAFGSPEVAIRIQHEQDLYRNFEEMYQNWKNLPESALKNLLMNEAYYFGKQFFQIWRDEFLPAIENGKKEEAQKLLLGPLTNAFQHQLLAVNEITKMLEEQNKKIEHEADQLYTSSWLLSLGVWFAILLLSSLFAYLVVHSITKRLENTWKRMNSVSSQINSYTDQQAKSAAQQSSSVHETTSAMDELNTSFQHTELLAQESSNRAKNALTVSTEGNRLTKQMLKEMTEHREKVLAILNQILHFSEIINQIHNVASTINNLTNQTNILALNAAVQAAHTKQNGEGFSVIASEIRKLADESKKFVSHIDLLAGNIKQATEASVHLAEEGSKTVQNSIKLAESSAQAFDTIISITTNSFEGAEQVSLNVKQQGQAVHQVLDTMEILNETAHLNLLGMQQVRGQLDQLNALSEELKSII